MSTRVKNREAGKKVIHHERKKQYRNHHFLTELPPSLANYTKGPSFRVEKLEEELHHRISEHIRRDAERMQSVLHFFKSHSKQPGHIKQMHLTVPEFHSILGSLNIFATQQEAELLFRKYDVHHHGYLTLYDFIRAVRLSDFNVGVEPDSVRPINDDLNADKRGKRMYIETHLFGTPVRAATPTVDFNEGIEGIFEQLREKCRVRQAAGTTHSMPQARRELNRLFTDVDPNRSGFCNEQQVRRNFHLINFPLGEAGLRMLLNAFRENRLFNYVRFVNAVYPLCHDSEAVMTSLPSSHDTCTAYWKPYESPSSSRMSTPQSRGSQTSRAGGRTMSRAGASVMAKTARGPAPGSQGSRGRGGAATYRAPAAAGPQMMVAGNNLDWSQSKFPPSFLQQYRQKK